MTGYFVADDGYGDPTLWHGDPDLASVAVFVRYELDRVDKALWPILTVVFTAPEDAVEHVAAALYAGTTTSNLVPWEGLSVGSKWHYRHDARNALAALRALGEAASADRLDLTPDVPCLCLPTECTQPAGGDQS